MRWFVDRMVGTWWLIVLALPMVGSAGLAQENIGQIPAGEERSKDYTVQVEGQDIPVYAVKVAPADPARRWKAMDDKVQLGRVLRQGGVRLLRHARAGGGDRDLPRADHVGEGAARSLKIVPAVEGRRLTFSLAEPKPVTIEVNGNWVGALHLFANPPEAQAPRPDDPNVIYFGPGVHEVAGVTVGNGKTVYVAAGAVVKGTGDRRGPVFTLQGENITLRGRGIIDGSLCPTHARNLLLVRGKDITDRGRHPPRFEHLDDSDPPVGPGDGEERQAARLPGQLRRDRHLQQPGRDGRGLLHPHAGRPDRGQDRQGAGREPAGSWRGTACSGTRWPMP